MEPIQSMWDRITLKKQSKGQQGFTIIEVLIVLVIASLIILIVFFAIPALQRNARNRQRDQDAALLAAAVRECLTLKVNQILLCDTPEELPLDTDDFSIYTGVLFGSTGPGYSIRVPPTINEPNWMFALRCNGSRTWFEDGEVREAVVTYVREVAGGTRNRCIDV